MDRRVRQGEALSAALFVTDNYGTHLKGLKIGKSVKVLVYADDILIVGRIKICLNREFSEIVQKAKKKYLEKPGTVQRVLCPQQED